MSEEIKVTITEQIEKINLTITESPKILVNVLNVATVDPSVANARNTAEAAAESASTSAEAAMTVLEQAQEIANQLPTMVEDEVSEQVGNLTTDDLDEGASNLYFTDARVESTVNALTTDSLPEGANNLYFTNARALSAAQESLDLKAPLASPVFTGEPEVPTVASALDSSDKIASTGFVQAVALNKVAGPESSVDNTIPRFDGETGKIIKGSGVKVDDTDNVSGINALTAESVNLDKLSIPEVVNSVLTGQNATLAVDSSKIILTNASLISIESITSSLANISCTIVNRTGNAITLLNNIGANGVVLPNAKDLRIDIDSSVRVMKSAEAGNKFIIDGGAGTGSGEDSDAIGTSVVLNVPGSYSSITSALNFLKGKRIKGDAEVTIKVADGSYSISEPIVISHQDGRKIKILGNETTPDNCVLNFGNTDGILVLNGTVGKVSGFKIVSTSRFSSSSWGSSNSGISSLRSSSIEIGNINISGFYYGLRSADNAAILVTSAVNVTLSGDGGFFAYAGGTIEFRAVTTSSFSSDTSKGLGFGYIAEAGGVMRFYSAATASNNAISGFYANMNGTIVGSGLSSISNGRHGFEIERASSVEITNSSASGNANDGLYVNNYSYALTSGWTGQVRAAGTTGIYQ